MVLVYIYYRKSPSFSLVLYRGQRRERSRQAQMQAEEDRATKNLLMYEI